MAVIVGDFKDRDGNWIKSYCYNRKQYSTAAYFLYTNLSSRCKEGSAYQKRQPRYVGCTMSERFKNFQFFSDWCQNSVGYNLPFYNLDKDILFAGNRIYSEDTSVFVPKALNCFLCDGEAARGLWPIGVNLQRTSGRFIAAVHIDGKTKHIGIYSDPNTAHQAYKAAKEAEARRWHERLKAGEFLVDERVIERMRTWTLTEDSK